MYQFFIQKNRKAAIGTAIYVAVIAGFIFIFYKLADSGQFNIRASAGADELTSNFLSSIFDSPLQKVATIFKLVLKEAVLYLPLGLFVAMLISQRRSLFRKNRALIILSAGIVFGGALAFALFEDQKDANQLFFNIANSLLNCCLIWVLIKLISDLLKKHPLAKVSKAYYAVGLIGLLIFSTQFVKVFKKSIYHSVTKEYYSERYLKKIKKYVLSDAKPNIGVAIKGGEDFKSSFSKQTAAYTLGYYLAYMENGSMALNISDFDIQNPTEEDKRDRSANLFCRLVNAQKETNTFNTIGQSQLDFIQKYDLDFVILSKNGKLRPEVQEIIKEQIVDNLSGERFLLIKRK